MGIKLYKPATVAAALVLLTPYTQCYAEPLMYRFTWIGSGTTTQSLQNVNAQMQFNTTTTNVVSINDQFDTHASLNLTGNFSSIEQNGQFSDLEVLIQTSPLSPTLSFRTSPASSQNAYEFYMLDPALAGYDLRSALAPVTTTNTNAVGDFTFDFGNSGVVNFTDISSATFQANTTVNNGITYDFSWTASGTHIQQFDNLNFEMTFWVDSQDIVSLNDLFNTHAALNLTGNFSGNELNGQFTDLEVLIMTSMLSPTLSFKTSSESTQDYEFAMLDQALDGYDLRSAFGPITTNNVYNLGDFSFDFGDQGVINFTDISSATFQAVVPVPAAVWLFSSGLIGLIGVARRKKV